MTTFEFWRPATCRLVVKTLLFFIFGSARAGDDERSKPRAFPYQPYSDREIAAAVQRPLTLNDCIRTALAKNIALRISRGDFQRAATAHAGSYGKFFPVLSVDGIRTNESVREDTSDSDVQPVPIFAETNFATTTQISGKAQLFTPSGATLQFATNLLRDAQFPFADNGTKMNNRAYSVSLSQPLLRGAGPTVARGSFLSTGYDQQIQEKNLINRQWQTVFAVKRAYFIALLQRELIKVNLTAMLKDSALVEASRALITARLATRRDVLSAEIRFADDRASLLASRSDYQFALDILKDVMGLPIEMAIAVDSAGLDFAPIALDEQALVRAALENNPLISSTEISLKRSELQRHLARNALWPQLDLVASYSSQLATDLLINRDLTRTGGWQANLSLNYPLLNRDAAAKAEDAELALSQQQDRLLDLQRQTMIDVRDIVRGVYSAAAQIQAIQAAIKVAEDKLEFSNTMFNLGRASNFDVTESQEFLLKAKNQYLRKLVDYHTQLAQLESLTGQPITP